jgi:catechol 2,3-dioxygenase-like lactoylglutathione lyase family enzyme
MKIVAIDHVVLTVEDVDRTIAWYGDVLGLSVTSYGDGRLALTFGEQKLNLHAAGREIAPHAQRPTPGSADVCFIVDASTDETVAALRQAGVEIELGPVERIGATATLTSVYVRDPDGNLVELASLGGAVDVDEVPVPIRDR